MYERYRPKKQNIISDTGTTIKNYCINMIINITGHYLFFLEMKVDSVQELHQMMIRAYREGCLNWS